MRAIGKRVIVPAIVIAAMALFSSIRSNSASRAVQVAFVGHTNFGNHTVVLFAITNRLSVDVHGTAYLQGKGIAGWRGHSAESQRNRVGWVGPVYGGAQSVTLLGIARPSTTNEWRIVVSFVAKSQGTVQKSRQRYGDFLTRRGFARLGAWMQPHPRPEYVFGPEMKTEPM